MDATTGATLAIVLTGQTTHAIGWKPDGSQIAYGGTDGAVEVAEAPTPPIASVGPDQIVTDADSSGSEVVTLDGSASSDPDGTIVAYSWAENGVELATGPTPSVDLALGAHTLTLTVTDDSGLTASDEVTITVTTASGCVIPDPPLSGDYTVAAGDVAGLLAALESANAGGSPASVALAPGSTYTLTTVDNADGYYGNNGLPYITGDVTVYGNCATIQRDPAAPNFRLFQVAASGSLTTQDLTLSGGNGGNKNGGGLYSKGTLHLTNTVVSNNVASGGGGLRNSGGTVTLTASTLANNTTSGSGGGLYSSGGMVTISGTTVRDNQAASYGGGIYLSSDGTITVSGSTLTGNSAHNGGAVFANGGTFTLAAGSVVSGNSVTNNGGGLYSNSSAMVISESTLVGNTAANTGGAIRSVGALEITSSVIGEAGNGNSAGDDGGGVYHSSGVLTVTSGVFAGNSATNDGGAAFLSGTVTFNGVTLTGNGARNGGGAFVVGGSLGVDMGSLVAANTATNRGGGLYNDANGSLTVTASTLSGNSALEDGGGIDNGGNLAVTASALLNNSAANEGGGLYNDNSGANAVHGSCLVGNSAASGSGAFSITAGLDATGNWWGAGDGPGEAGGGSGDGVNANVAFTPFLTGGCPQ